MIDAGWAPSHAFLPDELAHAFSHKLAVQRPDFLVISPPKTGSTWLAANLRCHPGIFIPDIKEIKYFSSYCRWFDLDWYLDHFAPAAGRFKGEASPSYAMLPVAKIRLIRRLLPDVKLVFLMRDPVARAWSHAKHNHRHREANFAGCSAPFEAISESRWRENFTHDWPLAGGDYLGQLRRWLSVFPREQIHVGFFESIAADPEALLRDVLAFLGATTDVDYSRFRLTEKILPGVAADLTPSLRESLQHLLSARTRRLAAFLDEHLDLHVPEEWHASLDAAPTADIPAREFDDHDLARLLDEEAAFPSSPRLLAEGYRGYNFVFYRGRLYALEQALGPVSLDGLDDADLRRIEERCLTASSLAGLRERVDQHIFEQVQTRIAAIEPLQAGLAHAHERITALEHRLGAALERVERQELRIRELEAEVVRLAPLHVKLARRLKRLLARSPSAPR